MSRKRKNQAIKKCKTELQEGLRLVRYEVAMLSVIYNACPIMEEELSNEERRFGGVRANPKGLFHNIWIEAFLIHARCLIDFFRYESGPRRDEDIYAADYFESPEEWIRVRGEMPEVLRESRELAHTRLAHISLARREKIKWPFTDIIAGIAELWERFLGGISDELKIDEPGDAE